jgi:membrane protein DedA with SNARE-associated domain
MLIYFSMHNAHEMLLMSSIEQFSYLGIFIFALFAGYIVPIPEEIILLIVGYMASIGYIHLVPAIFVVIIAFILGDNMLFQLTLKNNKHVTKFVNEVLSLKIIAKHRAFFEKNIGMTVFIFRFVPFLRFISPVFAGYVRAKEQTFMFFNTLAIVIYAPFLMWVGYFFHESFGDIVNEIGRVRHVAVILLWIIVGLVITRITDYIFRQSELDK